MAQRPATRLPWKLWRLANDPQTYGADADKLIITTDNGDDEVCGPFLFDEDAEFVIRAVRYYLKVGPGRRWKR